MRSHIWHKELGPVQCAIVFGIIGATVILVFSGLDASWLMYATLQGLLMSGMGAFGTWRPARCGTGSCRSQAKCRLLLAVLLVCIFAPALWIGGPKAAFVVLLFLGGFCGLVICLIGHWILIRHILAKGRAGTAEGEYVPH